MLVDKVIKPVEFTQAAGMNTNHQPSESFQDILKRKLNNKSNSRPPKIELSGLLIPCHQKHRGRIYKFKLGTQSDEYLLSIKYHQVEAAKKASWDEITVKGILDDESTVLEVEKMVLRQDAESELAPTMFREPTFDVDTYVRMISQKGKLEPALDYLAS